MKTILFIGMMMAISTSIICQPLTQTYTSHPEPIPSVLITVTVNKTTNLIFPFKVKNVDRGLEALLVQKVEGAEHILQIKAASAQMPETNLSVVTADLKLHVFLVRYDSCSTVSNYDLRQDLDVQELDPSNCSAYVHENLSEGAIQQSSEIVAGKKPYIGHTADKSFGVRLILNGIYVKQDILFFSLQLENGTGIGYDIESLQLSIRDKKRSRLTATQEILLSKQYTWGDTAMIESHTGQRLVLAVSKFTIPDQKECLLQLRETNGGRHLDLIFSNHLLMRAKEID